MPKVRLTDKYVSSVITPPGTRLEIYDEHPLGAGLMLRVSETGRKSWTMRYRTEDGEQRRFSLGQYPGVSLAEARKRSVLARLEAEDGADPAQAKRRRKEDRQTEPIKTFADLSETYFMACETGEWKPRSKRKRASTLAREKWLWSKHIKPHLGDYRLEEVTTASVKKILRALVAKGHDTSSNRVRAQIRQMFNFAIAEGRLSLNPVAKIPPLGEETPRDRILRDSEIVTIWSALDDPSGLTRESGVRRAGGRVYVGKPVAIAIKLLLRTLQRRQEVSGMRRAELDLEHGVWTIPPARTKNGRANLVPLSPQAVDLIKDAIGLADEGQANASAFVFPSRWNRENPTTPGALTRALRDVRIAVALPSLTPHDLRRTAASNMASERIRVSPFIIGRILNHTSETGGAAAVTLSTYALHDYMADKRAAMIAWNNVVDDILNAG